MYLPVTRGQNHESDIVATCHALESQSVAAALDGAPILTGMPQ
jgi:hypothetical protein